MWQQQGSVRLARGVPGQCRTPFEVQTHRHLFCLFFLLLAMEQNLGKSFGWAVPASGSIGAAGGQMGSLQGWRRGAVAKGTPRVGIHQLPPSQGH